MQELHSIPSVACGSCRVSLSRPLGRGCCSLCPGRYIRACVMLRFVPAIELARKGPCLPSGCVVLQLGKHTVAMEHVFDTNQSSLPLPFILVLVSISVMALSTVFHPVNSPDISPLSHSVLLVLFQPYWSFQLYTS